MTIRGATREASRANGDDRTVGSANAGLEKYNGWIVSSAAADLGFKGWRPKQKLIISRDIIADF